MLNRRFCKVVSCLLILSVVLGLGVIPSKVSAAGTTAVTGLKISVGSKDVTKTTYSMAVGKKKTLTVSAKPKAAAQVATFKSSDTSIVTVSSAGKVSALRPGTAKITVTISSSKYKKTTTWVKIKVKTPDYYKVNESGNEAYDGERKKPKYNNKVCEALGLEFWTDEDVSVTFPAEGDIIRNILVKNTSGENRGFSVRDVPDDAYTGSYTKYVKQYSSNAHPNLAWNPLAPGELAVIEVNLSFDNSLNDGKTHNISGDLSFYLPVDVFKDEVSRPVEARVTLNQKVSYISKDLLTGKKYKDATVKGKVLDAFGKPVSGAKVTLVNRYADESQEVTTGKDGTYQFKTNAYKLAYSGMWREQGLYFSAPGYIEKGVMVYPKTGKTVTIDPTLYYKEYEYIYERTKSVDIGLQGYEYDTDNETIAVFAPFHTGLPQEQIADRIKLTATDFDGNVLFTYKLPQEIPYVDVSSDGQYTVALVNARSNDSYKIAIVDKTGKEVYSTDDTELPKVTKFGVYTEDPRKDISRCAALSDDGNYLVAATNGGYVWYIDWKNNKVLWAEYIYGQVRNIKFSPDGSEVYILAGTGYTYAFNTSTGAVNWKSFVHSWAVKMIVTEKYIVVTTKNAGTNITCLERKTGKVVWEYAGQQGAPMGFSVSPDEKYLWTGYFTSAAFDANASSVFDLDRGKIVAAYNKVVVMGGEYTKDGKLFVQKDRTGFSVHNAKSGELLYSDRIAKEEDYSGSHAITANTDGSRIIVTMNTDIKNTCYCKTYYYKLTKKKKVK
ncbi:MAG: PQQ-binding-like beta-propeller repeat protein [Lachnospiraceae bacterium]|nr:PQQ-binding-like beta-propeller repeat protein [Lachnospiraceae bacterium]